MQCLSLQTICSTECVREAFLSSGFITVYVSYYPEQLHKNTKLNKNIADSLSHYRIMSFLDVYMFYNLLTNFYILRRKANKHLLQLLTETLFFELSLLSSVIACVFSTKYHTRLCSVLYVTSCH